MISLNDHRLTTTLINTKYLTSSARKTQNKRERERVSCHRVLHALNILLTCDSGITQINTMDLDAVVLMPDRHHVGTLVEDADGKHMK